MIRAKEPSKPAKAPKVERVSVGVPVIPMSAVDAAISAKFIPVTVSLDELLIKRLDDKAHAMRKTRSAALRVLLGEALAK